MAGDLPEYYFRVRENGAAVFRIDSGNRQQRLEMDQIAVVNIRSGEVQPHGLHRLTEAEEAEITRWVEQRRQVLAAREIDDIRRTVDQLNLTAQWVQSRADDAALEAVTDDLLLAMHDLRAALVRKKAERIERG